MKIRLAIVLVAMLSCVPLARASTTWSTKDGNMTIELPTGFVPSAEEDKDLEGSWEKEDSNSIVMVMLEDYAGEKIDTSILQNNIRKELPGVVFTGSSSSTLDGLDVYTINWSHSRGVINFHGKALFIPNGKHVYEIMGMSSSAVASDSSIMSVLNSIKMKKVSGGIPKPAIIAIAIVAGGFILRRVFRAVTN